MPWHPIVNMHKESLLMKLFQNKGRSLKVATRNCKANWNLKTNTIRFYMLWNNKVTNHQTVLLFRVDCFTPVRCNKKLFSSRNMDTVQLSSSMVERDSERNRAPFAVDMLFIHPKWFHQLGKRIVLKNKNKMEKTKCGLPWGAKGTKRNCCKHYKYKWGFNQCFIWSSASSWDTRPHNMYCVNDISH